MDTASDTQPESTNVAPAADIHPSTDNVESLALAQPVTNGLTVLSNAADSQPTNSGFGFPQTHQ
ncbi:hypothetical protein SERLA73DRAFT_138093, partial [Serpula lacrymans var. lacrymans S7.3]